MANITKTLRKESKHDSSPIITALGKGIYKAVTVVTNPTTKEVYIDPTGRGRLAAYIPALGGDPSKPMYFRHASNTGSFGAPVKDGEVILVFFADGGKATEGFWFAVAQEIPDIVSGGRLGIPKIDGSGMGESPFEDVLVGKVTPETVGEASVPDEEQENSTRNWNIGNQGTLSDILRGSSTASPRRDAGYKIPQLPKVTGMRTPGGSAVTIDDGSISDDGTIHPEQIRITTTSGASVVLDGGNDFIYVINSSGSGWVEIGASGEVMVYAEGSLSMRTEKDFNLRADKNINLEAGENIHMHSIGNTKINSDKEIHLRSKGNQFLQSEAGMNINVGVNCIVTTGSKLHLNGPLAPESELILIGDPVDDMQDLACTKIENTILSIIPTHEPFARSQAKELSTSEFAIASASDNGLAKAGMPRSSSGNPHR